MLLRNPRALVGDGRHRVLVFDAEGHRDGAVGGREADRVGEQVLEDLGQAIGRGDDVDLAVGQCEQELGAAAATAQPKGLDETLEQRIEGDPFEFFLIDPSVDAGDLAGLGEQPFHPRHVAWIMVRKRRRSHGVVDLEGHVGGRPDRGERVLELVRDIGGKRLGELEVLLEPAGELGQRPLEVADLVGSPARFEAPAEAAATVEDRPRRGDAAVARGRAMVVAISRVSTTATARLARKTWKTSSRTAYSAWQDATRSTGTPATAPSTSPSIRIGIAMWRHDRSTRPE